MGILRRHTDDPDRPGLLRRTRGLRERVILGFLLVAFAVGGLVVLLRIIGAGPAPDTPQGVLEEALRPVTYSFETQAVRLSTPFTPPEGEDAPVNEIHSLRAFAVDEKQDRFVGRVLHVLPETLTLSSDSQVTLARLGGGDWRELPSHIPASQIRPPMADALLGADPRAADAEWDVHSIAGKRAWVIDFTPTPAIIKSLLMTGPLGLSGPDQRAIAANEYTAVFARAVIARDERAIVRVDISITLNSGVKYRILSNYTRLNSTQITSSGAADG